MDIVDILIAKQLAGGGGSQPAPQKCTLHLEESGGTWSITESSADVATAVEAGKTFEVNINDGEFILPAQVYFDAMAVNNYVPVIPAFQNNTTSGIKLMILPDDNNPGAYIVKSYVFNLT